MEPDEKIKLTRALELSEENNKMLKNMMRNMRWGRLMRIVYWTVIIAISVGALYYAEPYINKLQVYYGNVKQTLDTVNQKLSTVK